MKTEVVFWKDTGSIELQITPESPTEHAMLHLLKTRKAVWEEGGDSMREHETLMFPKR